MKPAYAIYVLESKWLWDHVNHEFATITLEGVEGERYEKEFECLVDLECPPSLKSYVIKRLKDVAAAQNGGPWLSATLVRLYRVIDFEGIIQAQPRSGEAPRLNLTLKLICEFDEDGNFKV